MTERELKNLYYIEQRIKRLKYRIAELEQEDGLSGQVLTGMPHGTGVSNPVETFVMKKCELLDELKKALIDKLEEEKKIRTYIESIDDEEIKQIIELRFLYHLNWFEIGEEMNMERTTASKKMRRYLRTQLISHNSHHNFV